MGVCGNLNVCKMLTIKPRSKSSTVFAKRSHESAVVKKSKRFDENFDEKVGGLVCEVSGRYLI